MVYEPAGVINPSTKSFVTSGRFSSSIARLEYPHQNTQMLTYNL